MYTESKDLKHIGRHFQSLGAVDWKAQSPQV